MTYSWALRRYPRVINSAIAMASQVVRRRPMRRQGFQAYVINTRVAHVMGPLQSRDGSARFAQLYLLDPAMNQPEERDDAHANSENRSEREQQLRRWFRHAGTAAPSQRAQRLILAFVRELVRELQQVNSYVRDFVNAMEVIQQLPPASQHGVHLVLDRDARPSVYDRPELRHHSRLFDPSTAYGRNALRPEMFREVMHGRRSQSHSTL